MIPRLHIFSGWLWLALAGWSAAAETTHGAPQSGTPADLAAWTPVLEGEIAPGFAPLAMAIDAKDAIHMLEVRSGKNARLSARIRVWRRGGKTAPGVFADGFSVAGEGFRPAMLAWRGRVFLADSPRPRFFGGPDSDGGPFELPARFTPAENGAGTGFGGLAMGPDGRIYGCFAGGTVTSEGIDTNGGVAFRFEPDGSGFEIVERGLACPSTPMFDDFGRCVLLDHRSDRRSVLSELLDGGTADPARPHDPPLSFRGLPLGPAAMTDPKGTGGVALIGDAARPQLGWWRRTGDSLESGTLAMDRLPHGAKLLDLTGDWNGRPHLLLRRPGESGAPDRFEVLALGSAPENPEQSAGRLEEIEQFFSDPAREGASGLLDMLRDPERKIRISAQLAITRHTEVLALLMQAAGSADPRERLHALWAAGILARRGAGAATPDDDPEFAPLPNDKLARNAAQMIAPGLDSPDTVFRIQTLRTLTSGRRAAGLIPFTKLLADPNPKIGNEALLAAARMRWRALVSALSTMPTGRMAPSLDPNRLADVLDHTYSPPQLRIFPRSRNPLLRLAAVESLRRAASPVVEEFFTDPDPRVSGAAVRAAAESALPETMALAASIRFDKPWPPSWDTATCRALIDCAKATGKKNLSFRLAELVKENAAAAAAATEALKELEKNPSPE